MSSDRRRFLIGLGATPLALGAGVSAASAQAPEKKSVPDFPNAATFRSGDLVWPKKKGSLVPRTRSVQAAPAQERREWESARQQMLADPAAAGLSPEVAERLKTMSYEEFERVYFSAQSPPPQGASRSAGAVGRTISVGHVGLIEVAAQGIPYVVEATRSGPMERPPALFACAMRTGSRATPISRYGTAGSATWTRPPAGASWTWRDPSSASLTISSTSISTTTAASIARSSSG